MSRRPAALCALILMLTLAPGCASASRATDLEARSVDVAASPGTSPSATDTDTDTAVVDVSTEASIGWAGPDAVLRTTTGALDTAPPVDLAFADPCAAGADVADHRAALDALAPDWAAGDLMERIELPDGSALWIFGDSFLGAVDTGALEPGWRFVNNTALRQRGACFELVPGFGGGSWIPSVEADIVLWPQEALVLGDELFVFSIRIERDPSHPPGLDFRQVGGLIAVYDLDDLSVPRTMVFDVPDIRGNPFGWGALVEDGFVYAYAHEEPTGTFVARFPVDAVNAPERWTFWDGSGWVPDHGRAVPVIERRARVVADGDGYVAFSIPVFERNLEVWRAPAPEGPWSRAFVVDIEADGADPDPTVPSWVYEPLVIGDVSESATVAVNYLPFEPHLIPGQVALYGPRFIEVPLAAS
ncbi:MAG: hypothetical protein ACE367_06525 [Acidimicrobiales bacterium]